MKKDILGLFNFWKKKKRMDPIKANTEPISEYKKIKIDLQNKTKTLNGTLEKYWFANKNIGLTKTLFHKIIIPLKPFDSGIEYEQQPVDTSLIIEWLNLDLENPKNLNGINIKSDKTSEFDASIYIGNTHNPFDIKKLVFEKTDHNSYKIVGEIMVDFEHEMVAENEDFSFQTIVEFQQTE